MRLVTRIVALILFFEICTAMAFDIAFDKYRLPKNIRPTNYNLHIRVNPEDSKFTGTVLITLEISNGNTNRLFLHADHNYIKIDSMQLNGTACNYSLYHDPETQIFPVNCAMDIRSGQELVIEYTGKISREMNGLYKSTYENVILVATMFEPIYARRAFPCFDEPSFKATFEITIQHPSAYKAMANTPLEIATVTRNITETKFQKTPKMSTYLVALCISKFEPAIKRDQEFNVFARPSAAGNMGIATKYGQQLFDHMSQWTGLRYDDLGNPQQYLVAVPDFAAGAMENWGLINFRELALLDDGSGTSSESFQRIILVMSHEIAHQWFGNLVTLDWWSNLWLNEGFAEYFGKVVADMVNNGSLEMDNQFVVDITQTIMEKDAVFSANPLSSPEKSVSTALEISTRANEFAYLKGESIIRMMKYILGEEIFKKGLQNYLNENKYKNVNPEILLRTLQAAAGDSVINFEVRMRNWIYEPGFPLLQVNQTSPTTVTIEQERFCVSKQCSSIKWHVPISYTSRHESNFSVKITDWLTPGKNLTLPHNHHEWLVLNILESGYYRVNYDDILWENIIKALSTPEGIKSIHPLNRAQLIDDIFHIAKIGRVSYEKAFKLAKYLEKETSYYPWVSAIRSFSYLISNLDSDSGKILQNWLLKMATTAFHRLLVRKPPSHIENLRESAISQLTCKLGLRSCRIYARAQFLAFRSENRPLSVNKQYLILCYGLVESNNLEEDYKFLMDVFKTSKSAHQQYTILSALGCMQDKEMLLNYLNLTLMENSPIREQDFAIVFNSVYYNNKKGISVALDFMDKNFKAMEIAYGDPTILSALILDIAEKVSSLVELEKMNKILMNHKNNENIKITGPSVMDIISSNQQWKAQYGNEIKDILMKTYNGGIHYIANINIIMTTLIILVYFTY